MGHGTKATDSPCSYQVLIDFAGINGSLYDVRAPLGQFPDILNGGF